MALIRAERRDSLRATVSDATADAAMHFRLGHLECGAGLIALPLIAASTFLIKVRIRLRRALFTSLNASLRRIRFSRLMVGHLALSFVVSGETDFRRRRVYALIPYTVKAFSRF